MNGADGTMALIQGLALGAGICLTLGPQSLYVLRQGIRGEKALATAAICTAADFVLIAAAAAGASALVMSFPEAMRYGVWGGALFTLAFGALTLAAAFRPAAAVGHHLTTPRSAATALALSFLNPQVYFEMVAMVGGVSLQFEPGDRTLFALGVGLISPVWFFGLALGGRKLSGLFASARAQSLLDGATGVLMLALAGLIVASETGLF